MENLYLNQHISINFYQWILLISFVQKKTSLCKLILSTLNKQHILVIIKILVFLCITNKINNSDNVIGDDQSKWNLCQNVQSLSHINNSFI